MNALFDKAIAAVSRLPDVEQKAIAREVPDRIEAMHAGISFLLIRGRAAF